MRQGLDVNLRLGQRGALIRDAVRAERRHGPLRTEIIAGDRIEAVRFQQLGELANNHSRIMRRRTTTDYISDETAAVRVADAQHRCVMATAGQVTKRVIDQTRAWRQLERTGVIYCSVNG